VSSGDGAIALYGQDVLCTRDAGETMFATFRGDEVQRTTMATCSSRGAVVAVAGTRSLGGEDQQTLRRAHAGGALEYVSGSPRGNPVDLRVRDDGSFIALLERGDGAFVAVGPAEGAVNEETLDTRHGRAIGNWGPDLWLVTPRASVRVYGRGGFERARAIEGESAGIFFATTRVGRELVGVTRDGTIAVLAN
jgi:hypothetical protein